MSTAYPKTYLNDDHYLNHVLRKEMHGANRRARRFGYPDYATFYASLPAEEPVRGHILDLFFYRPEPHRRSTFKWSKADRRKYCRRYGITRRAYLEERYRDSNA